MLGWIQLNKAILEFDGSQIKYFKVGESTPAARRIFEVEDVLDEAGEVVDVEILEGEDGSLFARAFLAGDLDDLVRRLMAKLDDKSLEVQLRKDLENEAFRKALEGNEELVRSWEAARNLSDEIKLNPHDLEVLANIISTVKRSPYDLAGEIPNDLPSCRAWFEKFKKLDVASVDDFEQLTYTQKLMHLYQAWKAYYPQIFFERKLFEDFMGKYRYIKPGFGHSNDIAHNFKAVDFYNEFTVIGEVIFSESAISMKTTTTIDIEKWLKSGPVKKNILDLEDNLGAGKGITWNGKTLFYNRAEIHIYMPNEIYTDEIRTAWLNKLESEFPVLNFDVKTIESL